MLPATSVSGQHSKDRDVHLRGMCCCREYCFIGPRPGAKLTVNLNSGDRHANCVLRLVLDVTRRSKQVYLRG
jgi:hypothetical protein